MEIQRFKALWGMEGGFEQQLARAAAAGYAGVEAPPPGESEAEAFAAALEAHGLAYIAQIFVSGEYDAEFKERASYAARFKPLLIVSHSARDSMSEGEQDRFFDRALAAEADLGIAVGHETHRQRAMFTPWTTARLLRRFPSLRLTADFSHWMNVCESHLDDQQEQLAIAIERTIHIHGRIGYPEGPQVPHPGAPEYRTELAIFAGWWQRIWAQQAAEGKPVTTFTAEFGPPGYMHTLPFTGAPVADLWEVNQWMTDYATRLFEEWQPKSR